MVNIASKSVKTRRKSLVCKEVILQTGHPRHTPVFAGRTCSQNGFGFSAINHQPVAWRKVEVVSRKSRPYIAGLCDRLYLKTVIPSLRAKRSNLISYLTTGTGDAETLRWRKGTQGKEGSPDLSLSKGEDVKKKFKNILAVPAKFYNRKYDYSCMYRRCNLTWNSSVRRENIVLTVEEYL